MHRQEFSRFAIACITALIVGSVCIWFGAAYGAARSTPATPKSGKDAVTPTSLDELLAMCPADDAVSIPEAKRGFFAPWGYGQDPVWLVGWGNRAVATPAADETAVPDTTERWVVPNDGVKIAGYGWPMKALWAVSGEFSGVVTVSGASTDGRIQLWIQIGADTPVKRAKLDATASSLMQSGGWRQYPSYVIFPATGCYELVAEWDGGSWHAQVPFLAPDDSL